MEWNIACGEGKVKTEKQYKHTTFVDENITVVYTFISRPSGTYISAQSGTAATALLQGAIENRTTCC